MEGGWLDIFTPFEDLELGNPALLWHRMDENIVLFSKSL
jgi:hypothetical protein